MAYSLKSINGVQLDTLAWGLEVGTSPTSSLPGRRTSDVVVPGRPGVVRGTLEPTEPTQFALNVWTMGTRPDGTFVSGRTPMEGVEANLQKLLGLFSSPTVTLVRNVDGVESSASCRVIAAVQPNLGTVGTLARFTVVLDNPDVYWTETRTTQITRTNVTAGRYRLTELTGTQPISDALLIMYGACSAPALTDVASGHKISIPVALGTGEYWRVDGGTYYSGVTTSTQTYLQRPDRNRAVPLWQLTSRTEQAANGDLSQVVDVDVPACSQFTITARRRFL